MKRLSSLLFFLIIFSNLVSQNVRFPDLKDTIANKEFIDKIDQAVQLFYNELALDSNQIDSLNTFFDLSESPKFSDSVYCERLDVLNQNSDFHLDCNKSTLSVIRLFAHKKRNFIKIVLGRSNLYFDLYEAKLAEYGLPDELKYLSVIESGLRPKVKSRAGALGLWQFMYKTGKYFGLKENAYIDERMDPYKATDAACRYLKKLHDIYGDWNLALASYNAGPGNVNKAIRRSGNKKSYWEVRPYLPRETQGYVPNFIAATYVMKYYKEHNLVPVNPKQKRIFLDTICLTNSLHMETVSQFLNFDLQTIKEYNTAYKKTFIPQSNPPNCILLPMKMANEIAGSEDSLYRLEKLIYNPELQNKDVDSTNKKLPKLEAYFIHSVKAKQTLTSIALMYEVSINEIVLWNDLKSVELKVGEELKIKIKNPLKQIVKDPVSSDNYKKYHYVRSGENLTIIAKRNGVSLNRLKRLNPKINPNRLRVGQKVRIR